MKSDRVPDLVKSRQVPGLRQLSITLLALGLMLLGAGGLYSAQQILCRWLAGQDRLLTVDAAALSIPEVVSSATPEQSTPPGTPARPSIRSATPDAVPQPELLRAVRLEIPVLKVSRSIINLPRLHDSQTGAWTHDVDSLFHHGRKDLVGHWEGSACPGQEGNMILVGHNYARGVNGVFQRLGRLKVGHKVYVTDDAGQTFTYSVTTVQRLRWKEKGSQELAAHWQYLSPEGPERLTLVTCGGALFEPFPQRVYVVAEPVH